MRRTRETELSRRAGEGRPRARTRMEASAGGTRQAPRGQPPPARCRPEVADARRLRDARCRHRLEYQAFDAACERYKIHTDEVHEPDAAAFHSGSWRSEE